jgi:hypothetical protein
MALSESVISNLLDRLPDHPAAYAKDFAPAVPSEENGGKLPKMSRTLLNGRFTAANLR